MSTDQPQQPTTTTTATDQRVPKWGDPISGIPAERQAELRRLAEEQRVWVASASDGQRDLDQSAFKGARLTGLEVFFLAACTLAGSTGDVEDQAVQLRAVKRDDPTTRMALPSLHLEGADLRATHLEGADLRAANLEGASLYHANLVSASLAFAHLENVNLSSAHLEGTDLAHAHLEGANLRAAHFSTSSSLWRAAISDTKHGAVRVADARWQDVNLAVISQWGKVTMLGDEQAARKLARKPLPKAASRADRGRAREMQNEEMLEAWRFGTRANRQLASVMRDQGMNDEADRFAYRGNLCQRQLYQVQGQHLRRFGSWLLDLVSGYGYKPMRSVVTYLLIVFGFAVAYFLLGNNVSPALDPLSAFVFSITSFHGRGFVPGENVMLNNPLTVLAAGEAITGLLIEITFIATFTQRFFAR